MRTYLNVLCKSILMLIVCMVFSTSIFAYPNNNATYIMNSSFGACGVDGVGGNYIADPGSTCEGCHTPAGGYTPVITLNTPTLVQRSDSRSYTISTNQGASAGFNLTVLDNVGISTGSLSGAGANAVVDGTMVRHTQATVGKSWSFTWQAPPGASGDMRMCYCVNSVDGTANGSYDFISGIDNDNNICGYKQIKVNNAPVAINDSITLIEDSSTSFNVITRGTPDSDTESNTLSVTSYTGAGGITGLSCSTGTVPSCTINTVSYDSLDDDEPPGILNFTYTLSDGNWTDIGAVQITINGANDAPVANADAINVAIAGTATTLQDGITTSVLVNDTDADANEATKESYLVTDVIFGTLSLSTNGTFSYTHDGSNNLFDSFSYRVWDGTTYSSNTIVSINIANTEPTAVNDLLVATILEGGSSSALNVIGNDTDPETSVIAVGSVTNQANGTAVAQGDQTVIFTHDGSETTSASFQYTANDGFLTSLSSATVTLTITPVNDPPVFTVIGTQTATENTLFSFDAAVFLTDPDDVNNGTDITWSFKSGQQTGMTISNLGVINWTPPQTGVFNQSYGPVVIQATDGEPLSDTASFSIVVSPPDGDSDNVADYNDLCLTIADSTNADNDSDGTPGSDGDVNDGGDVCDLDDDNDTIPDAYELANIMNPFDANDASSDNDGDGITNLQEYLDGTNPNIADLVIDATGYFTPYTLIPPAPTSVHADATGVIADDYGPYRPGLHSITWTAFNNSNAFLDTGIQTLSVRPVLSFLANQLAEEGDTITVIATLNGLAASYPVTVNYSVSGTADLTDHNASGSSLIINSPDQSVSFTFDVSVDAIAETDETVVFTITNANNAVIGSNRAHTVTITEGNVMPSVEIQMSQGVSSVASAYVSKGLVSVDVIISDVNTSQSHSIDWSNTDNSLSAPTDNVTAGWSFSPAVGVFLLEVNVTDSGSPTLSNRISRILNIASTAPTLNSVDSDGDGINDDVEGLGDGDADGIPDYLDAYDGTAGESNLLANQTVDLTTQYLIETEPGLTLTLGNTSMAANNFGIMVTDADIATYGSKSGGTPLNAGDDFDHVGGTYDFEIKGLLPGSVASIVLPLQTPIPNDAEYRKFNPATGWGSFIEDASNRVGSAPGELGACPEPGSDLYQAGLNYLDNCLQLTIEDGGPNDIDATANGIIKDPGSVGLQLTDAVIPSVRGGGQVHPWLLVWLFGLVSLLATAQLRRKNKF